MTRLQNDIAPWDFSKILETFGASKSNARSYAANTRAELERLLADPDFAACKTIQLLAVKLPKEDAPRALKKQAQLVRRRHRRSTPRRAGKLTGVTDGAGECRLVKRARCKGRGHCSTSDVEDAR